VWNDVVTTDDVVSELIEFLLQKEGLWNKNDVISSVKQDQGEDNGSLGGQCK